MIPNFIKSSGRTLWIKSLNTGLSFLVLTFAPKPIPLLSVFKRLAMISSMPTNAPPTMNNILVVKKVGNHWYPCIKHNWTGDIVIPRKIELIFNMHFTIND